MLDWKVFPDLFNSDHFPIFINSSLLTPGMVRPKRWCLKSAKWGGYRNSLKLPREFVSPTLTCGAITVSIKEAGLQNIKITEGPVKNNHCKNWWTKKCHDAWVHKKKAWNRYKNRRSEETFIIFKKTRACMRRAILEARKESWNAYVSEINSTTKSSEVWRKIKVIDKGQVGSINIVLKVEKTIIHDKQEVSDKFAEHFSKLGESAPDITADMLAVTSNLHYSQSEYYNSDFTMKELIGVLKRAKSSSPGPDFVPVDFIRNMSEYQLSSMLYFYNQVWNHGIPDQWRESIVIPLLKFGKVPTSVLSYRPIALTNNMCKIFEKMVNTRLMKYLESTNLLTNCQSGFRDRHSALDAICRLKSSIQHCFMRREHCIAVFIDISAAFDSVNHISLMSKIKDLGISGNLAMFI